METSSNVLYFSWIDYTLFILMLSLSALIGVYFGFFGKKQDSPKEYLHGGKKMKIFPIAASLIASDTSGITLLGVPADIYLNGSSFTLCIFAPMIIVIFVSNVFLPVFYKLQVSSTFEYLKMRFSNRICVMTSLFYTINGLIYLPVVIYMPALAFGQVTGLNLNIVIPIVCVICIFYTTIGGIKAVVWTDTLQMFMMIGSLIVVFILGVVIEGGFENIWQKSDKGSRIDFNLDFDPTSRTAAFTIIFGLTVFWCSYGHNPVFVQRFLAVPTLRHAKITLILFTLGVIFFKAFTSFLGLIIYAHYTDCDPLTAGYIQKVDQILPYYVMDVTSTLPGLPGLFIAGIFCAALSTMSSGLNTMSGTIYADFIQPRMPKDTTEKRASDIMKLIVVVLGLICMGLVFIIQFLGAILQLTFVLGGITGGPMLAMFVLGMLIPSVNEKGILCGSITGLIITGWIVIGTQYYILTGQLTAKALPTSTEACSYLSTNATGTLHDALSEETNDVLFPYKLSFYYYGLLGFLSTTLVTIPVSLCTGGRQQHVDKDLLCPLIHSLLATKYKKRRKQEVENEKELIRLNKNNMDTDYLD